VLNLRGVPTHEADELTFGGVVQWLGEKLHVSPGVFGLAQDDAEMYRIT